MITSNLKTLKNNTLLLLMFSCSALASEQSNFDVLQDSYIRGGNFSQQNYQQTNSDQLIVKNSLKNDSYDRRSLVSFDMDSLSGEVETAVLNLYVVDARMAQLYLQSVDNDWLEGSVTWDSQPAVVSQSTTAHPVSASQSQQWIKIDVTELVNQPGFLGSFLISSSNNSYIVLGSKEQQKGANLQVSYQADANIETVQRFAMADSFVRGGSYANQSYNESYNRVKNSANDSYDRKTFIHFDEHPAGSVDQATLKLFVKSEAGTQLTVERTDTGWNESDLTWNTQPAVQTDHQVTVDINEAIENQWIDIDVTTLFTGLEAAASFVISNDNRTMVSIADKKSAHPAELILQTRLKQPALDCSLYEAEPNGYSNFRDNRVYRLDSAFFYRLPGSALNQNDDQFSFCLSPDIQVTATRHQSHISDSGSLIWEGQVSGTGNSLEERLGNSVTLVKRNGQIIGTVWVNGELYRVWPVADGLHRMEKVTGRSVLTNYDGAGTQSTLSASVSSQFDDSSTEADGATPVIKLLVAYTAKADSLVADIEALIDLTITETNAGFRNSNINVRVELAHTVITDYAASGFLPTDLSRLVSPTDGNMDNLHSLRDQYEADVAVLIGSSSSALAPGILVGADKAFIIVNYDVATGLYSMAHEIGHLLGAQHEWGSNKPYAFGHGYMDLDEVWRTVMSYNCPLDCLNINLWSNPEISFLGRPAGTIDRSNNARVLNQNASAVASFRGAAIRDISGTGAELRNNVAVNGISGDQYESVHFFLEVPAGASDLKFEISGGSGDADLYTKAVSMVTPLSYDCSHQRNGNNGSCELQEPQAVRYYVIVYGYRSFSDVTLIGRYTESDIE